MRQAEAIKERHRPWYHQVRKMLNPQRPLDYLKDSTIEAIEAIEKKIVDYQSAIKKSRQGHRHALKTAKSEIFADAKKLLSGPLQNANLPMEILILGKDVLGHSIWVLHSYLRYLKSFLYLSMERRSLNKREHQYVLQTIQDKTPFKESKLTQAQIFQCLFNEFSLESEKDGHITPLEIPKIESTLILVSGLFNELYKTAAFERGAKYMQEKYGIKYHALKIHGRRGSNHNAQLIEEQLKNHLAKHPKEKFWIVAHSKGGIDSLHFLRRNLEFSSQHIVGLSTIAAPIMGSPHTEGAVVNLLQMLLKLEKTAIFKKLDRGKDFLLKNVPRYLSENFQQRWFERNSKYLPQNIFYSSLALQSQWYKSHLWMLFAKFLFQSGRPNDGIVDIDQAHFPHSFPHINLGAIDAHHLVGTRSSGFNQEALLLAHVMTLHYLGVLT